MTHSQQHMLEALMLAELGRNTVAPNPMVGCLIVKDGEIIGRGWHEKPGGPHAEVMALLEAGDRAKGASVYVNLEPCSHHGRTPPCVEALIKAQVAEVHFPFIDPNPKVSGQGLATLHAAGIKTFVGEYAAEARKLNEIFLHYIEHKRPFVIAKWAMSLDGKLVTAPSDSRQITGSKAQSHLHGIRQSISAILIGAETARTDNPQLTSRLPNAMAQPVRIVLNASANLPLDLKLFSNELPGKTLVVTSPQASILWCQQLIERGIEVIKLSADAEGRIELMPLLEELGRRELSSLLVEGGPQILKSFMVQGLVNKVYAYMAPVIISELPIKQKVVWEQIEACGDDYFFAANLRKE
ncbi:MAG: bifunctional diaminohydroxyphosphoribosylaminopyrimidine deaminase/5-amino-6-(5-phosphoribosylamino)uracil reductase RibD [Gammaproteobacteria bacterium]|nr:bifunctional diaminohydroxyphosphoribosylaminopyrimidine deaminase/5-amino-6-(5-phosphoribosylamino)uracil reductase RibD [Gammaproteobacteria bacterium]